MSYFKRILDRLMQVQKKFYGELKPAIESEDAEGRTSILEIVGPDGGSYKLQVRGGFITWADANAEPKHIFRISEDAFLSVLSRERELDECFDKKTATILNYGDETINLVELVKWKRAIRELSHVLDKVLGGEKA